MSRARSLAAAGLALRARASRRSVRRMVTSGRTAVAGIDTSAAVGAHPGAFRPSAAVLGSPNIQMVCPDAGRAIILSDGLIPVRNTDLVAPADWEVSPARRVQYA